MRKKWSAANAGGGRGVAAAAVRGAPLVLLILLCATAVQAAEITFVSPAAGGQAVGVLPIEITTTVMQVDRVDFYVDGALAGVARKAPYRILHDFGTTLVSREVVAKIYSNGYRDTIIARVLTAALTAGEVVNVDLVEVPLRVRASRTLRAEDLRVRENGVEQMIRELRSDRGPARFVFVVDRSLSMSGGRLDAALTAIDEETKLLRASDRVEVILFNHVVGRARTLARGERVSRLIGNTATSGGTSLRDAVSSVDTRDRAYVILMTDGGDRNSAISEEDALRKISGTRTVVDAIILGDQSRFLERATKNTGGTLAHATASTLQRELHKIILDINSRYTLAYQSHGTKSGWRTIAIEPRRSGITIVNARKGYFAQ